MFDPCFTSFRHLNPLVAFQKLRCDLLSLNQPCSLLNIIIPSVTKTDHDHCYYRTTENADRQSDILSVNTNMNNSNSFEDSAFVELEEKTVTAEEVLEGLHLTPEEMLLLERDTRSQSICLQWYEAHCIGIIGSKCGRIIAQKK